LAEKNKGMLKIYHNPRCRKSREGLDYLKSKIKEFEIVDYMKQGLTFDNIKEILLKTNLKPAELVRKQEGDYKKDLKGKSFTDEEWIKIICENPKLLIRPIIISKHKAALGDPVENIDALLSK
jgi:arsenate reductase (glutaredoxin)